MARNIPKPIQSLNEILGISSAPAADDWPLAHRVFAAGSKPLSALTDWDLGLLLRQRIGAPHVLPLAFRRLRDDLWNEAGLYPGGLAIAALRNRGRVSSVELGAQLELLVGEVRSRAGELPDSDRRVFEQELDTVLAGPA